MRTCSRTVLVMLVGIVLQACHAAPRTTVERTSLHQEVNVAIAAFKAKDARAEELFDTAYGYAVFPTVNKGAIGIGGAHGRGEVYQEKKHIGYCDLSQGTIGLQLGGQAYREVIFFQQEWTLANFKMGKFALAAQVSAVGATTGVSADAAYEHGVAVFTMAKGGLMYEASIGGQKFRFVPKPTSVTNASEP